jgi:hypothetical protein
MHHFMSNSPGDGYVVVTQLFWDGGIFTPSSARQYDREP